MLCYYREFAVLTLLVPKNQSSVSAFVLQLPTLADLAF